MATIYCSKATGNYAKIDFLDCTEEEAKVVEKHMYNWFSYFNEKKMFTWEYEQGRTDAVEHIYDAKKHLLPIGLLPMLKVRTKMFPNYKLAISEDIRALFTPKTPVTEEDIRKYAETLSMVNKEGKKITPYDHQVKLILRALNGRRISLMACTAAGKSLAMYIMSRYLLEKEHKKVLIITPSSALVEQLYSNFKDDYGWKEVDDYCTLIHGESKDKLTASDKQKLSDLNLGEEVMLKDITISTWQSLQNKPDKFFAVFGAIITDEAHGVRGIQLREILDKCVNAEDFKVGVSGTLPDNGLDAALIESALGRKEVVVRSYELIQKGVLSTLEIYGIRIPYPQDKAMYMCRQNYKTEFAVLTNNGSRKVVMDLLISSGYINTEQNTVILYKKKDTLEDMHQYLREKYPQFKYHVIIGEVSPLERDKMRGEVNSSKGNIIIATYGTMKQGVNIEFLHNLVFAEFSKSMYEVVQSIGRVIRFHKDKEIARVYDIFDDCSYTTRGGNTKENYSLKHYKTRLKYYKDDLFPVKEINLRGVFEGSITADPNKKNKPKKERKTTGRKKKETKAVPKFYAKNYTPQVW